MNRREFLGKGLAGAATLALARSSQSAAQPGHPELRPQSSTVSDSAQPTVTAGDVHNYLRSLGATWVDPTKTVDTFKAGSPDTVVRGIAVGWMSYFWALRRAVRIACNLFITHEPTFYAHRDDDLSIFEFQVAREKKEFIERTGLVIIRCHDVWDRMRDIGITDSWAELLGLKHRVQKSDFCQAYQIPKTRSLDFARRVAECVGYLGEEAVQLVGPPDKRVRRVAIGTGAITPFRHMVKDLGAELCVCTDDGFSYWRDGSLAIDMGLPVVIVHHACSEEFGMKQLANHLLEKYPHIPVHHIPQKCMFKTIRG